LSLFKRKGKKLAQRIKNSSRNFVETPKKELCLYKSPRDWISREKELRTFLLVRLSQWLFTHANINLKKVEKLKNSRNRTMAAVIALFLISTIAVTLVALPAANAHTPPWQVPTFAYIVVAPDPVGVSQTVTIYLWLDKTFDSETLYNNYRFHNYKLTITKPDKTTETMTFDTISDPTSSIFTKYTPTQVGTYTFKFDFPGQDYNTYSHSPTSSYVNDTYVASTASTTLTVQETPLPEPITSYPLPSQYWTRPMYGENTDWWAISSDWLGTGAPVLSATGSGAISGFGTGSAIQRLPGDAVGPQTAHVMWTKPLRSGGVVGGNVYPVPGVGYFEGSAYNNVYTNPIIVDGRLYYTEPVSYSGVTSGPTDCVDLRTGEVIWSRTDVPSLSFGYIYDVYTPNQHGVYPPILFTSSFARAFDAFTGNPLFNVTGVPSGSVAMGSQGEQLRYVMTNSGNSTNPDYRLAEWNSTKLWTWTGLSPSIDTTTTTTSTNVTTTTWVNGVLTNTITTVTTSTTAVNASIFDSSNSHNRYDWNVTIPWRNTMTGSPTVLAAFYNNIMLCRNGSYPGIGSWNPYTYFAVNLNASKGTVGSVLWWNTVSSPPGNITISYGGADPTVNVFIEGYKETMQWVGYSLTTGQKLWGPTHSQAPFDYYGNPIYPYVASQVAFGRLYSSAFAGILYCYDLKNGNLLWTYGNGGAGNSTNAGFYAAYGDYPTFINAVGGSSLDNGKIYLVTTEHTITDPIYKGALTRCVNASNGAEIWTLSAYTGEFGAMSYAIADGFATFFNGYDNQIYSVGRGPSTTTVQAPMTPITAGTSAIIQGTVMDISAGTKQNQQAADFPNGVPCVSDASMGDWMGYVYQQKPCPTNATGVTVSIDALDPNGNYIHIATVTSETTGLFHYAWTPPNIPGEYTLTATFVGTNGYWPSYAQTVMYVSETPPSPTPTPAAAPLPPYETYILVATVAIIIAIAIVGILLLRKRQ
jgi:hypothetical protein